MLARIDPVQAQSGASGAAAQVRALEAEERGAAEQIRGATPISRSPKRAPATRISS